MKNTLFEWVFAQIILWQIEHLKSSHKKESIDLNFFNEHNTLTPIKLAILPYMIASSTEKRKGFGCFGKWKGVEITGTITVVPEGWDVFVSSLYNGNFGKYEVEKIEYSDWDIEYIPRTGYVTVPRTGTIKRRKDGKNLRLSTLDIPVPETTPDMDILLDGIQSFRSFNTDRALEARDGEVLRVVRHTSPVQVLLILWDKFCKENPLSPGSDFLCEAFQTCKHQFAKDVEDRILC